MFIQLVPSSIPRSSLLTSRFSSPSIVSALPLWLSSLNGRFLWLPYDLMLAVSSSWKVIHVDPTDPNLHHLSTSFFNPMRILTLILFSIDLPFLTLFLESPCMVNSMPSPMATSSWFCSLPGFFSNPSGRSSMPNSSSLSPCSADKQRHIPLPIVSCPHATPHQSQCHTHAGHTQNVCVCVWVVDVCVCAIVRCCSCCCIVFLNGGSIQTIYVVKLRKNKEGRKFWRKSVWLICSLNNGLWTPIIIILIYVWHTTSTDGYRDILRYHTTTIKRILRYDIHLWIIINSSFKRDLPPLLYFIQFTQHTILRVNQQGLFIGTWSMISQNNINLWYDKTLTKSHEIINYETPNNMQIRFRKYLIEDNLPSNTDQACLQCMSSRKWIGLQQHLRLLYGLVWSMLRSGNKKME